MVGVFQLLDENRKLRVELNTLVKDNEKVENRLKSLLRQKQNKTSEGNQISYWGITATFVNGLC